MPSPADGTDIDALIEKIIVRMAKEWVRILRRERRKMAEIFDEEDD